MFTRPDNSTTPSAVLSSDIDNAELAARLGINRLRRSGRVILYDDFSDGLAWSISLGGIYTLYYGNVRPFTPPGMLVLIGTRAVSALAITEFPMTSTKLMGVEVTYKLDGEYLPNLVDSFTMTVEAGGAQASIRLDLLNQRWQYLGALGTYVTIPNAVVTPIVTTGWYNVKWIVDLETKTYKRLYFNRLEYPINQTCLSNPGGSGGTFTLDALDGYTSPAGVFVDNVILTTDESY